MIDGTAQPERVRAFHVTDHDITTLAARFAQPRPSTRSGPAQWPASARTGQTVNAPARIAGYSRHHRPRPGWWPDGAPRLLWGFESWWRRAGIGRLLRPPHPTHRYRRVRPRSGGVDTVQQPPRPVCPSCSDLYARDTWQLVHAGTAGGHHDIPAAVADRPQVFVTLTAPSYGPVHTTARAGEKTPPGVPRPRRHWRIQPVPAWKTTVVQHQPTGTATSRWDSRSARTATTTPGTSCSPGTCPNSGDASPSPCAAPCAES